MFYHPLSTAPYYGLPDQSLFICIRLIIMCRHCSKLQIWTRQVFPLPSRRVQSGLWAHKAEFLVGGSADYSAWQEPSWGLGSQSSEHLTRWPAGAGAGWNPTPSMLFKGSRLDLLGRDSEHERLLWNGWGDTGTSSYLQMDSSQHYEIFIISLYVIIIVCLLFTVISQKGFLSAYLSL